MKRSEINRLIRKAEGFFERRAFHLPRWAFWEPAEWKRRAAEAAEVLECMLGWDLTDFGGGDFARRGLLLFTIRNGRADSGSKSYAEKIMIVEEDQETPLHFHWSKMEDIINRGGGRLVLELYNSTPDERPADTPVTVAVDGLRRTLPAGSRVVLDAGESICLPRGLYHRFYGERGCGAVLVGEVSAVNDDRRDNRFLEDLGRFPSIEEDEPPYRLLVGDYSAWT